MNLGDGANSAAMKTAANPQAAHRRPPQDPASLPQDAPAASERVAKLDQDETRAARAPSTGSHSPPPAGRPRGRAFANASSRSDPMTS